MKTSPRRIAFPATSLCLVAALMALVAVACRSSHEASGRHLTIELLALDLTTCGRCTGTEANLDAALAAVAERLRAEGARVEVCRTVVRTADQATALRFESSPTIRVNGSDIALELRESDCKDCGDLCGSKGGVDCRVWVWQGREYLEAPREMIETAVLAACKADAPAAPAAPTTDKPFSLPANLQRFFAAAASTKTALPAEGACCDKTSCCKEPAAKGEKPCCDTAAPAGACCPKK